MIVHLHLYDRCVRVGDDTESRARHTHDRLLYSITPNATVSAGQKLVGVALPLDDGEG
jgi:hypothetical protein